MGSIVYFRLSSIDKVDLAQIPKTVPKKAIPLLFSYAGKSIVMTRMFEQGPKAKRPVFNWNGPDRISIEAKDKPQLCYMVLEKMHQLSKALGDDGFVTKATLQEYRDKYYAIGDPKAKTEAEEPKKKPVKKSVVKSAVKLSETAPAETVAKVETPKSKPVKEEVKVATTKSGTKARVLFATKKASDVTDEDSFDVDPKSRAKHGKNRVNTAVRRKTK
jgi:hypothetical protein